MAQIRLLNNNNNLTCFAIPSTAIKIKFACCTLIFYLLLVLNGCTSTRITADSRNLKVPITLNDYAGQDKNLCNDTLSTISVRIKDVDYRYWYFITAYGDHTTTSWGITSQAETKNPLEGALLRFTEGRNCAAIQDASFTIVRKHIFVPLIYLIGGNFWLKDKTTVRMKGKICPCSKSKAEW